MRGGLQRAAAQAARTAYAAGVAPTLRQAGAAVATWPHAWKVAVAVLAIIVVRVVEVFPRLAVFRPAILTLGLGLALTAAHTPRARWQALARDRQFRLVVAYIGWAALMVPFALWKAASYGLAKNMVMIDVFVVATVLLCAPRLRTLDKLLLAYVVSASAYAVIVARSGAVVEGDRLTTIGSYDPNDLAALLCTALPMACALMVRRGAATWQRLVGLVGAVVLAYAVTRTGSRGGLIGLAVGAAVLLGGFEARRLVPIALAATVAAPVLWTTAPETFRTRARSLFALENDYTTQSTSGREYIWRRGLVFFAKSPLIGVGPGNFGTRLGRDFSDQRTVGAWHTAHNTYIQLLVEMGVVGTGLFVAMLLTFGRAAARVYRRRPAAPGVPAPHYPELMASLASFCATAAFLSHAYVHFTFFLLALGGYLHNTFDAELGPAASKRR